MKITGKIDFKEQNKINELQLRLIATILSLFGLCGY